MIETFRFASPWFLSLLFLIPVLALLPYWASRRYRPTGLRYADTALTKTAVYSWRLNFRPVLPLLRWLALALLILALARPQTGSAREVIQGEGVDIVLVLDISSSMGSLDFFPQSRLEAARQVIQDFITARPYDRIGLVVFAQDAFTQSPPTVDHAVLSRLLRIVDLAPALGIEDGTAIGMGLAVGSNMLKDSPAESKVIILLTDGVNNAGRISPLTAAEAAKALDIKTYTIGAGRPDPLRPQEVTLDEETLRQIADTTGGLYYRAEDSDGLRQIYAEINELEKSEIDIQVYTSYEELMGQLLIPGLLLLMLEFLLRQTFFRKIP